MLHPGRAKPTRDVRRANKPLLDRSDPLLLPTIARITILFLNDLPSVNPSGELSRFAADDADSRG